MKLASEDAAGLWVPLDPSLEAVLLRLEALSTEPTFAVQRQVALGRALASYLEASARTPLAPLSEEVELATLYVYADFYPEDGQLTLIEQLRDVITEHIPEEERAWLDPLKHSYLDLVEVVPSDNREKELVLRSLGDGRTYRVRAGDFSKGLQPGQVLFTRLIRVPGDPESEEAVIAGNALVLSKADGQALYNSTGDYRRELEIAVGSFALREWQEFAKRYGHVLLWKFAQMRFAALVEAVVSIRYTTTAGHPYLYAIALYEHHEFSHIADNLSRVTEFQPEPVTHPNGETVSSQRLCRWVQREVPMNPDSQVVARLTLTSTQLMMECDSRERLDAIKHTLAATFGFSLHFRGETVSPPSRQLTSSQLTGEGPLTLSVSPEEDRSLLNSFLETVYLEWADQDSPALGSQTPRHAASSAAGRARVGALIDEMERYDPGLRRTGVPAFDYNTLRAHIGLEEVRR